jgi:hypothetical protein
LKKVFHILTMALMVSALVAGGALAQDDDDTAAPELVEALVVIDDETVSQVDPHLFGVNLVAGHVYGDDAGGIWSPETLACGGGIVGCYRPSSFDLLRRVNPKMLRFPGGRLTRSYDWTDGIGPAAGRETLFGTDEFLFLAAKIDATPVITLSLYDPDTGDFATPTVFEEALAWVVYVNEASPYGPVVYWEVDADTWENEDHPVAPDVRFKRVAPEAYAEAFLEMATMLKGAYPNLQLGAVSYENERVEDAARLMEAFVSSGADPELWPDFLTMSFFRPNFNPDRCDLWEKDLDAELDKIMRAAFAAGRELDRRLSDLLNVNDDIFGRDKPGVPVLITGYNTQLLFAEKYTNHPGPGDPPDCPFRDLAHSLGAALFNTDVLITALTYSDRLLGAAMWDFMDYDSAEPGFYGSAYLFGGEAVQRPNVMALRMLSRDFSVDEILTSTTVVSTFDNEQVGRTPGYESISLGPNENYIRVRVVRNREPVENTPDCGVGNIHNPDPGSTIQGLFALDNLSLQQDDVPPDFAVDLLTNGDFRNELSQGWQVGADPVGVTTERICQSGECWLEVDFAGTANPDYQNTISQTVQVQPGGRYRLQYDFAVKDLNVKTQNLICDPSFEFTSTPGAFNNDYWVQFTSTPAPAQVIQTGCFDGDNCVRVPIVGDPEYFHVRQRYPLAATDPDQYHIVGAVRTDALDGPVTIEAQARTAADQLIQAAGSFGVFGTTDWQFQEARLNLGDRAATAFINMHLRRKEGRKDNGVAFFDDVRMYREETVYAPKIAVDICEDAACTIKRTIETDGVVGTRWWTGDSLGGTPILQTLAGRGEGEVNILLVNKDLTRAVDAAVDLSLLGLPAGRAIFVSRLTAAEVDADNELGTLAPEIDVPFDGGSYYGTLNGSQIQLLLPPHSATALKIVDPVIPGGDDDDSTADDDDDDSTADDDDDASPDDDATGDDDDDSGGCGC